MAEVTYYYNTSHFHGDNWVDSAYMIDGILTTYAYTSVNGAYERTYATTCNGTDLGTITKVEIRCYGYGDGNDRIDLSFSDFAPVSPEYQLTMPSSPGWSSYADVTADPNINGWTWAKVADILSGASLYLIVEMDAVAKGNTMHCAKVEIRVTYTEVGAKTTQYLAGKDCPEFPHEQDIQSDKLPCPLPF